MRPIDKNISRCVGLWLAEGDRRTISEITFTNNSKELISLFHKTLVKIFRNNFRLYVYTNPNCNVSDFKININVIKFYTDKRAKKPYYILRLADRKAVIRWHKIVKRTVKREINYIYILQGFFAGEGNIKESSHHSRQIRIAQKKPMKIIDIILKQYKITYTFSERERAYVISGRNNWEKFYRMKIAILHPEKEKKFLKIYSNFTEWHYKHNYIRNELMKILREPKTCKELAHAFNRKQSRIQDVVIDLKKEGLINNFRVGSLTYWILNDANKIIISRRKAQILNLLKEPKRTFQIADKLGISDKALRNRLMELEKLNLIKRDNYYWEKIDSKKEVTVI